MKMFFEKWVNQMGLIQQKVLKMKGLNYYFKGHNAKLSLDYTYVNHSDTNDQNIFYR